MLLVGNGRLITRDEAFPYAEDGAVALDGEVIKEVGALSELRAKYPDAEFVDARGGVIMPGLINVHTHIYSGLARVPSRVRCRSMYHHWPSSTSRKLVGLNPSMDRPRARPE